MECCRSSYVNTWGTALIWLWCNYKLILRFLLNTQKLSWHKVSHSLSIKVFCISNCVSKIQISLNRLKKQQSIWKIKRWNRATYCINCFNKARNLIQNDDLSISSFWKYKEYVSIMLKNFIVKIRNTIEWHSRDLRLENIVSMVCINWSYHSFAWNSSKPVDFVWNTFDSNIVIWSIIELLDLPTIRAYQLTNSS